MLYKTGEDKATLIGNAVTDDRGQFEINNVDADETAALHLVASTGDSTESEVLLVGMADDVGPDLLQTVQINELSTVARLGR